MADGTSVQVVVRLRPLNKTEKQKGTVPVVTCSTQKKEVTIVKGMGRNAARHNFHFDNVFGSFATQEEIFDQTLAPIVQDVLGGYESCVFAYGQTGTGKTYTMEGNIDHPDERGVIPRAALSIFEQLSDERYISFSAKVSYLEIYNEELSDLLTPVGEKSKIQICSSGKQTVCVGLKQIAVSSADEVLEIIRSAQEKRQVAETKMNQASSRSHCLFTLTIESTERIPEGNIQRTGKLHLCDLAGSECAKASDGNQTRLRESMNINKSLLTLGRVINAVKNNAPRIPYRDSKLTRLLQDALGGACKTCIIATVSPSFLCAEESLSTLHYADRAQGIKNKPINASVRMAMVTPGSPQAPRRQSIANGEEGNVDSLTFKEMEMRISYMESQCEEAQAALGRKHMLLQAATDRAEELEAELIGAREAKEEMEGLLNESQSACEALREQLVIQLSEAAKANHLLSAQRKTEAALSQESKTLLNKLEDAISQTSQRLDEVNKLRESDQLKRNACQNFNNVAKTSLKEIQNVLNKLKSNAEDGTGEVSSHFSSVSNSIQSLLVQMQDQAQSSSHDTQQIFSSVDKLVNSNGESKSEHLRNLTNGCDTQMSKLRDTALSDRDAIREELMNVIQLVTARSSELQSYHKDETNKLQCTGDLLTKQANDLKSALNGTWKLSESMIGEHSSKLEEVGNSLKEISTKLEQSHLELEQKQLKRMGELRKFQQQASKMHCTALEQHKARIAATSTALHDKNLDEKHQQTLRLLEQQRESAQQFVDEHTQLLLESLATTCDEQTTHVARIESQHHQGLVETAVHLSEGVNRAVSQLTAQQSRMKQMSQEQKMGHDLGSIHQDTIQGAGQCVGESMTSRRSELSKQRTLLEETLVGHQQGTLEKEQLAELRKAKQLVDTESNRQLSLAAKQKEQLAHLKQVQERMGREMVETVMSNLQQLLANQVQELTSTICNQTETVESELGNLCQVTQQLQLQYADSHQIATQQVEKWGSCAKVVGENIAHATTANSNIDDKLDKFTEQYSQINSTLYEEASKLELHNNEIGKLAQVVTEGNIEMEQSTLGLQDTLNNELDALGSAAKEWVVQDKAFVSAVRSANQATKESHEEQCANWSTLKTTIATALDETKVWGMGNKTCFEELRNECIAVEQSRIEVEQSGLRFVEDAGSLESHQETVMRDTTQLAENAQQVTSMLDLERCEYQTDTQKKIGQAFNTMNASCQEMHESCGDQVSQATERLANTMGTQSAHCAMVQKVVDVASRQTEEMCEHVNAATDEQTKLTTAMVEKLNGEQKLLSNEIQSAIDHGKEIELTFGKCFTKHVSDANAALEKASTELDSLLCTRLGETKTLTGKGETTTQDVEHTVEEFCTKDMMMNDQVPTPMDLEAIEYSRSLTTSPPDEVILKDFVAPELAVINHGNKDESVVSNEAVDTRNNLEHDETDIVSSIDEDCSTEASESSCAATVNNSGDVSRRILEPVENKVETTSGVNPECGNDTIKTGIPRPQIRHSKENDTNNVVE